MILATPLLFLPLVTSPQSAFGQETFVPEASAAPDEIHAGQLSDDLSLDLLLVCGDSLDYVHECGSIAARSTILGSGAAGAVVLPALNGTGRDVIVYSSASGLHKLTKAPGSTPSFSFLDLGLPVFAGRELYTAPWNGADILVGWNGVTLVSNEWGGGSVPPPIAPNGTVHDVSAMDWNGVGSDELLVLVDDRLNVYDQGGDLIDFRVGQPGGELAISRAASGRDVAFWQYPGGAGAVLVAVHSNGFGEMLFPDAAGPLLALDQDGDGYDDIVRLGQGGVQGLAPGSGDLLLRLNGAQSFAGMPALMNAAGGVSPSEACFGIPPNRTIVAGAAGDFDRDGDADYLLSTNGVEQHEIRIRVNQRVNEEAQRMTWEPQSNVVVEGGTETMTLVFWPPANQSWWSSATDLKLEMWMQPSFLGVGRVPVAGAAAPFIELPSGPGPFAVDFVAPLESLLAVRSYQIKAVERTAGGEIVDEWPATHFFHVPNPQLHELVLGALPNGCKDPGEGGGVLNGGRGGYGGGEEEEPPP